MLKKQFMLENICCVYEPNLCRAPHPALAPCHPPGWLWQGEHWPMQTAVLPEDDQSVAEGQPWSRSEMMPGQGSITGQHSTWKPSQGQQLCFQLPDPHSPLLLVKQVSLYVQRWSLKKDFFLESGVSSHHLFHCFVSTASFHSCMLFPFLFEVCNQSSNSVFSSAGSCSDQESPSLLTVSPPLWFVTHRFRIGI